MTLTPCSLACQAFGPPVRRPANRTAGLFGCHGHDRVDRDVLATQLALVKRNAALNEREQRMILAKTNVSAWPDAGAALTNENIASQCMFAAELLYAEATTRRITAVTR